MAFTRTGVAATVRAEAARRRMPQRVLAEHLGLPQQGISARLRCVTPFTVDELAALAELFGMTLSELTALAEPVPA